MGKNNANFSIYPNNKKVWVTYKQIPGNTQCGNFGGDWKCKGRGAKAEGHERNVHVETDPNNPFTCAKAYDIIEKDYLPCRDDLIRKTEKEGLWQKDYFGGMTNECGT